MALPDEEFIDGFDKYGVVGSVQPNIQMLMGEWNDDVTTANGASSFNLVAPLSGDGEGFALRLHMASNTTNATNITKILDGNYKRVSGGVTFKHIAIHANSQWGVVYYDGSTAQFAVTFDALGTFSIRRGTEKGTILGTTTDAPSIGTTNVFQWDITIDGSNGEASFWLNGVPCSVVFELDGLDLTSNANVYFNRIGFQCTGAAFSGCTMEVDHFHQRFWLDPADGEGPPLTNPVIDTDYSNEDFAVSFTPVQHIIGESHRVGTPVATPAANSLILKPFEAEADGELHSMTMVLNATSAPAKFTGVLYADNGLGTAPAALLDSGAEVVGCVAGTPVVSAMNSTAIVKGTIYWIGFIVDTALSTYVRDTTLTGYRAANTYTSGPPNPAPAMTGAQGAWFVQGLMDALVENYTQLREIPPNSNSYNIGDTVGQKDLFGFDALTVTPLEIHTVAFKPNLRRTDAGPRTVSIICESGGTEASSSPVAPATSGQWTPGYYQVDPNTGVTWTAAGLLASHGGYEIIT